MHDAADQSRAHRARCQRCLPRPSHPPTAQATGESSAAFVPLCRLRSGGHPRAWAHRSMNLKNVKGGWRLLHAFVGLLRTAGRTCGDGGHDAGPIREEARVTRPPVQPPHHHTHTLLYKYIMQGVGSGRRHTLGDVALDGGTVETGDSLLLGPVSTGAAITTNACGLPQRSDATLSSTLCSVVSQPHPTLSHTFHCTFPSTYRRDFCT